MVSNTDGSAASPGLCIDCDRPLTRNPHPHAGEPGHPEASYVWICVPCLVENRHRWARRARLAEASEHDQRTRNERTVDYLTKLLDGPLDSVTAMVAEAAIKGLTTPATEVVHA